MTEQPQALELVESLGDPVAFKRELTHRIQSAYAWLSAQRGPVTRPEDVFDLVRRIGREHDQLKAYGAALAGAVKLLKQLAEEELVEAVGEQEGIPNQGLTIPDSEGDIRLSLDAPKVYEIDMDQVRSVHSLRMEDLAVHILGRNLTESEAMIIHAVVAATFSQIADWGKFDPQVSKVKAYAATLARSGEDASAAIVSSAISEKHPYKGVKFERNSPK